MSKESTRRKSYWQPVRVLGSDDHDTLRAWFAPLADDMTPYQADILCDVETDREKKLRAFMVDKDGHHYQFTRTCGYRRYTSTMKRIEGQTDVQR